MFWVESARRQYQHQPYLFDHSMRGSTRLSADGGTMCSPPMDDASLPKKRAASTIRYALHKWTVILTL
jgi:hypothetical protein